MLNWFEKWMLRGIAKKLSRQGGQNPKIQEYYSYMVKAARKEYTEDNDTTLRHYLEEMHSVECNKQFKHATKKIFKVPENQDRVIVDVNDIIFSAIVVGVNGFDVTIMAEYDASDSVLIINECQILENKGTFLV